MSPPHVRSRARTLLRVDALSGVPLITGVLLTVVALAVGASASGRVGLAGLADPLNFVLDACTYLGPASAAAAAAHLGWQTRSAMSLIAETAPRGRWRTWLLATASSMLWAVFAYTAMLVVVLVTVDLDGPRSWGMVLLGVQGLVLVAACTVVGAAVGARLTMTWIPPVVALAVYAVLFYLDVTSGPLDRFSVTYSGVAYRVNTEPNTALLVDVSMTVVAVCVVVVLVARLRPPLPVTVALAVATVGLVVGGVSTVSAAPSTDTTYRDGGPAVCGTAAGTDGTVRLCVFAESAPQLQPMLGALGRVYRAASPLFDPPTDFFQRDVDHPVPGSVPVEIPPNVEKGGQLSRAVDAVVPGSTCTDRFIDDLFAVKMLLHERMSPGSTGSSDIRDLAQQPDATQQAWLRPHLDRLITC